MAISRSVFSSITVLLILFLIGGCASTTGDPSTRTELYFGLLRRDGRAVQSAEWREFVDREVTRAFPEGFTVVDAEGAWRPAGGGETRHEPSKLLVVIHAGDPDTRQRIAKLRALYCRLFDQSSVLQVDQKVSASF